VRASRFARYEEEARNGQANVEQDLHTESKKLQQLGEEKQLLQQMVTEGTDLIAPADKAGTMDKQLHQQVRKGPSTPTGISDFLRRISAQHTWLRVSSDLCRRLDLS
jgi:hypothetical protein